MASIGTPSSVTRVVAVTTGLGIVHPDRQVTAVIRRFSQRQPRRQRYRSGCGPDQPRINPGTSRTGRRWGKLRLAAEQRSIMSVLKALTDAIRDSSVEVIDLTAPLTSDTPIINLPEPFGNTARFTLTEISHAGAAHSFDPPFPCHSALLGAGKYGLTQLRNLGRMPVPGAVVVTGPLPIVSGSGSPCRALALVERS